ncbi:MAG: hypothetical protein KDI92_07140 [Xanthomonadales bacterium]|nr:hypothetical protein [Xanthomonadales bacterium]
MSFDNSSKTQKTSLFYVEDFEENLPRFREAVAAPEVNVIYYNPNFTYNPPLRADGTSFPNSDFTSAWNDGFNTANEGDSDCGTTNLSSSYRLLVSYNSIQCNGNNFANGNQNGEHAYYYDFDDNATDYGDKNNYTLVTIPDAQKQNFANWYSYYKTRNMLIKSSASRAMGVLDEKFKIAWQSFKQNNAFEVDMMPMRGTHRDALWDWLFGLKGGGSDAMNNAMIEAGIQFENNHQWYYKDGVGSSVADELECQQNFHVVLTNNYANGPSTDYSSYTDEKVGSSVGNFTYTGSGESAIYKNNDTRTFADLTFHYWARDIHPHLANRVPRYFSTGERADGSVWEDLVAQEWWEDEGVFWNPANDPANWQHVVNFVIGFGLKGVNDMPQLEEVIRPDGTIDYRVVNPPVFYDYRRGNETWPTTARGNQAKDAELDDMWHAALNSRGEFLNVRSPGQLEHALTALLERLKNRRTGSSSVATISSNIITENTNLYRTSFDSSDWSGSVISQEVTADGTLGNNQWDAACLLTGGPCGALGGADVAQNPTPDNRKIFTYDRFSKTQHNFEDGSLSTHHVLQLAKAKQVLNLTATIPQVIDYLRGDRSLEKRNGGVFRDRRVLLGDVIHSSAKVVRGPSESYNDDAFPNDSNIKQDDNTYGNREYKDFKADNATRQNILLVGANDGMLHAFDANTGIEKWAFIPSQALDNIHLLTDPDYTHQNYVDSTPIVRDVYIGGATGGWKTIAVGGLRLGGQGYYALDITDPNNPSVLWEFTEKNDVEMGYSYGEPFITRLPDNKWVALLPNGYNSIVNDGLQGTGQSVLYMVDIVDGSLVKKFTTGEGSYTRPNGMAGAVVSDVKYDITGDVIFVGDLRGDIYRIDLNENGYPMEKMIKSINPYQVPIATPLRLTQYINYSNSPRDVMVHFGTGKYIELTDRTVIPPDIYQYTGGILDQGYGASVYPIDILGVHNDQMVEQEITASGDERTFTNNPVDKATDLGWYVKLPELGERVIAKMASRASAHLLVYASYLPTANTGCSTGGASWVMVADNRTGGQPAGGSVLRDGTADGVYIENQVFGITPIGFAGGGEILIISTDDGGTNCEEGEECNDTTITIPDFTWRRRSWNRIDI